MLHSQLSLPIPLLKINPGHLSREQEGTGQWVCLNYTECIASSFSFWAVGLSWQPDFVELLRVFAIGNCLCFIWTRDIGSQGRKWDGFPDVKNCDIGKHGGIRVNFISRWKQCLSMMSNDLQNYYVFFHGLEQCPNRFFMVLGSHVA